MSSGVVIICCKLNTAYDMDWICCSVQFYYLTNAQSNTFCYLLQQALFNSPSFYYFKVALISQDCENQLIDKDLTTYLFEMLFKHKQ